VTEEEIVQVRLEEVEAEREKVICDFLNLVEDCHPDFCDHSHKKRRELAHRLGDLTDQIKGLKTGIMLRQMRSPRVVLPPPAPESERTQRIAGGGGGGIFILPLHR